MNMIYFVYFSLTCFPLIFNFVLTLPSFLKNVIFSLHMLIILVYICFTLNMFILNENTSFFMVFVYF